MGSSEAEQEFEDRWWLGLRGRSVVEVEVRDFNIAIAFGNGCALTIEGYATMRIGPASPEVQVLTINADGTVTVGSELVALRGQAVVSGVAFKSGSLRLVFSTGTQLLVPFDEHYEAWQFTGASGVTLISRPSGGVATFPAREP